MEQKFDMERYAAGASVYCDSCGQEIDMEKQTATRVIAKDEDGFDVVEQFFTCASCGRHYTVTVIDHEQQKLIQQRRQLRKEIRLHIQIRSREKTIERLQRKDDFLKREQIRRAEKLKAKYKGECEDD